MADPRSPKSPRKGKVVNLRVTFLNDTVHAFQVPVKAVGLVLWDAVVSHLQLLESDYFGLEYTNHYGDESWLDNSKQILKQLPSPDTPLRFGVKFYTPDPSMLEEELTRYFFALQVRRDLYTGELHCSENTAALLASYIVQGEIGDFLVDEYRDISYLSSFKFLPQRQQTVEMLQKVMDYHQQHIGESPSEADSNLLDTARKVEMYGIKFHPAKDHEGVSLNLAVAHMGVLVFQGMTKINTFSWAKVRKLSFKRKKFLIKLHPESYGYYKDTVEFFFDSRDRCKYFWKKCIEHHSFFRCQTIKKLPRSKTRVVSRGSSFRYSGRTQKELQEYVRDNVIKRPAIERSVSGRISSRSTSVTPKISAKPSVHNSLDLHNSTASSGSHILETSSTGLPPLPPTRLETAEIHSDSSMSGSRSLGSPRLEHGLSADSEGGDFITQPVDTAAVDARLPHSDSQDDEKKEEEAVSPAADTPSARRSRSKSPRVRMLQGESISMEGSMQKSYKDRSPSLTRRFELVHYNKLPARDSYSSVDDTTSPSSELDVLKPVEIRSPQTGSEQSGMSWENTTTGVDSAGLIKETPFDESANVLKQPVEENVWKDKTVGGQDKKVDNVSAGKLLKEGIDILLLSPPGVQPSLPSRVQPQLPPRPPNPTVEAEPPPITPVLTTICTNTATVTKPLVSPKPQKPPVMPKTFLASHKPPVAPKTLASRKPEPAQWSVIPPLTSLNALLPPPPPPPFWGAGASVVTDQEDFPPPPCDLAIPPLPMGGSEICGGDESDLDAFPPPPSELLVGLSPQSSFIMTPESPTTMPSPPSDTGILSSASHQEVRQHHEWQGQWKAKGMPASTTSTLNAFEIPQAIAADQRAPTSGRVSWRQESKEEAKDWRIKPEAGDCSNQTVPEGSGPPLALDLPSPAAALMYSDTQSSPQVAASPSVLMFSTFRPDNSESDSLAVPTTTAANATGIPMTLVVDTDDNDCKDPCHRWSLERVEEEPSVEGDERKEKMTTKTEPKRVSWHEDTESAHSFHSDVSMTVMPSPLGEVPASSFEGSPHRDDIDSCDILETLENLRRHGSESDITYSGSSATSSDENGVEDHGTAKEVYLQYAASKCLAETGKFNTVDSGMGEMSEGTMTTNASHNRDTSPLDMLERLESLEGSFVSDAGKNSASVDDFPPPPPFLQSAGSSSSSLSSVGMAAGAVVIAGEKRPSVDPLLSLEGRDFADLTYTTSESESDFDEATFLPWKQPPAAKVAFGDEMAGGDCGHRIQDQEKL